MVQKQSVYFHFLVAPFYFPERSRLKQFIQWLFKNEKVPLRTASYIFCSDDYLLDINRQYLNHDYYTDIITFPISEPGEPVSSDIFISVERVRENALEFGTSFRRELLRVIFHGALHLCGYKDKTAKEREAMREKEEFYLIRYFVPRVTRVLK